MYSVYYQPGEERVILFSSKAQNFLGVSTLEEAKQKIVQLSTKPQYILESRKYKVFFDGCAIKALTPPP